MAAINSIRTPHTRFENLPGYDFTPHYVDVDGLRMHYVDEGTGDVVLLLHGEPSWSYLYRKMIPPLLNAGYRVIAPDLIGFGKSDKPVRQADYSYARHVEWMKQFVAALDLNDINLFCHDWGSLIGLRALPTLVPTEPDNPASDDNRRAWAVLEQWQKPLLTTFSNRDSITRGAERPFQQRVPGAQNREHVKIRNAGHFLQEDKSDELADALVDFFRA